MERLPIPWRAAPAALLLLAPAAGAQTPPATPPTIEACYVPASGTIYRIDTAASPAPGAPAACLSAAHVRFLWNQQGPKGDKGDAGAPGAAGVAATNAAGALDLGGPHGLVAQGTFGSGNLATTSPGTMVLWYPHAAAFRAGRATGTEWSASTLGNYSAGFGYSPRATGDYTLAAGFFAQALGNYSVAFGANVAAYNDGTAVIGQSLEAHGLHAMALGYNGNAFHAGSLVIGDGSAALSNPVRSTAANQVTFRAAGGVRFFSTANTTQGQVGANGCFLAAGGTGWSCTSDRRAKTGFRPLAGEYVLGRLRAMPVTTWAMRAEPGAPRHAGPMAQDFHRAFGLGADSVTINASDAQGVALAAAQALEARTRALRAENAALRGRLAALDARLMRLEGEHARTAARRAVGSASASAARRPAARPTSAPTSAPAPSVVGRP